VIIETDLGHDPDDFFTLCYLVAIGKTIDCITITPGDPDQLAVAHLLKRILSLDCPVGVSKLDREKHSLGGLHYDLLRKYKMFDIDSYKGKHDGLGESVIESVYNGQDFFVIGPATNVRRFLETTGRCVSNTRLTFQGGFLPYKYFEPDLRLEEFEGIDAIGSFNMNGDKKAVPVIVNSDIRSKTFIGKHICHTVEFTREHYDNLHSNGSRAANLFVEAANILFRYTENKKMHDLVAAACMCDDTLFDSIPCDVFHRKGGWTSTPNSESSCNVITKLHREEFWNKVLNFL